VDESERGPPVIGLQEPELLHLVDRVPDSDRESLSGVAVVVVVKLDFAETIRRQLAQHLENVPVDLISRKKPCVLGRPAGAVEVALGERAIAARPLLSSLETPIGLK